MTIRLAVTGATGRMGEAVLEQAGSDAAVTVAVAVNREPPDSPVAGHAITDGTTFEDDLEENDVDCIIDFTAPTACVDYAAVAAEAGVAFVSGTTGLSEDQQRILEAHAESIPLMLAANFSPGIVALRAAVRTAVSALPDYDIELTETHHNRKQDAPSGTALSLLEDIEDERESTGRTHGRVGEAPRNHGEIGVHARRAGDIRGEHEVLLADNDEVISLTHRAEDRGVFAAGAIQAAKWISGRPPGWYAFADVVGAKS